MTLDVDLELYNSNAPGTVLASRSSTVADAWALETERASAITEFDAFLAVHGARLRVRMSLDGTAPGVVTYARVRQPIGE